MMLAALQFAARHGRACLVLGLLGGLLLPGLAQTIKPALPVLITLMIFVAALRIGPRAALGEIRDLPGALRILAIYQIAMPLAALGLFWALGLAGTPVAFAIVLMLTAPSVTGSANFTILLGHDPAPALRLMVLGTAIFPFSVLPVLWLLPGLEGPSVLLAAGRLLAAIALATGAAFLIRALFWREMKPGHRDALDGVSALLLAVAVIGLMSALGPTLRSDPLAALGWLAVVLVANLGLQALAFAAFRHRDDAVPLSIIAGNRNVALFLIALSPEVSAPLLIFIACYQIPMYLTPIVMGPVYRFARAP